MNYEFVSYCISFSFLLMLSSAVNDENKNSFPQINHKKKESKKKTSSGVSIFFTVTHILHFVIQVFTLLVLQL
jgi:hypothetical protein